MSQDNVSTLLTRWSNGDKAARERLLPMVYDELRRIGRGYFRGGAQQSVLQPTVLVHEAWLRFMKKDSLPVENRAHFFALAARVMRTILVDVQRQRGTQKRGGSQVKVSLAPEIPAREAQVQDVLLLNDAMERLGTIRPRYQQIVELRFFGGLSIEETAAVLETSHATIEREWRVARAWLRRELSGTRNGE